MSHRILIIDDDEYILEVAKTTLEVMGDHEVLTAASGAEGVRLAVAEQPDAIILDVMMPDLDGRSTYRLLAADPRTSAIPVVFLTAKAKAAELEAIASLGAAAVLSKPFDPMTFSDQLAAGLGWSR